MPAAEHLPSAPHPLDQMTTFELRDYRAQLEHAVEGLSDEAPAAGTLRRLLSECLAEQDERARIAHAR